MTQNNTKNTAMRNLTSNELAAVSGGALPLPLLVAVAVALAANGIKQLVNKDKSGA